MTCAEATEILKAPKFGDQTCIQARNLLLLKEEVIAAAWEAGYSINSKYLDSCNEEALKEELELCWEMESA